MTYGQLIDQVSSWLDDLNNGYFTRPQIGLWLNNAQYELQKLLDGAGENYYTKPVQTTCVQNQADYVLPLDHRNTQSLVIVDNPGTSSEVEVPIMSTTLNSRFRYSQQSGYPEAYCLKRNRIVLFPKPDTTYTMRLYYSPRVINMVNESEVPNAPEEYHEYLAILATLDGMARDSRDNTEWLQKKLVYEARLAADSDERVEDRPRSIVCLDDDSYGGLS